MQKRQQPVSGDGITGFECTIAVEDVEAIASAINRAGGKTTMKPYLIEGVGTQIMTALSEITIEPISDSAAVGSASFQTRLDMPTGNFEFGGVFTMLLERNERQWTFVTGHTSTQAHRHRAADR